MAVDWKSAGRKSYPYPELHGKKSGSRIALEWDRVGDETYYRLFAMRNDAFRTILEFRVPDYMWQENQPVLYGDF